MRLAFLSVFCFLFVLRAETKIADFQKLPLAFENSGTNSFIARPRGRTVQVDAGKLRLGGATIVFSGAKDSRGWASDELPGKVNLIQGNDATKWKMGLATYGRVTYSETYPGIDVVYYGNQQKLEFDFVVKPGADPRKITMNVGGADKLSLQPDGSLTIGSKLMLALPKIYQQIDGKQRDVPGRFALRHNRKIGFVLAKYDRSKPLTIDPTIVYSTMLPGGHSDPDLPNYASGTRTAGTAITVDRSGNAIFAGSTNTGDFPLVNAIANNVGSYAASGFVTKMNSTGTAILYSTYFGDVAETSIAAIAVDSTGAVWATGYTRSQYLMTLHPVQALNGGDMDAFVMKLDPAGALLFSTYLGGPGRDLGRGIYVDSADNAYVTGEASGTFPTTSGALQVTPASSDVFVAKYTSTGSQVFCATIGGSGYDYGSSVAVDTSSNVYVTGTTGSHSFTGQPKSAYQPENGGNQDTFIAKLNATGTAYSAFTFLGGAGDETGASIAVDSGGNAFIAGTTSSSGLATTGAAVTGLAGATHGFVANLKADASGFNYITYIGGSRVDWLNAMALDSAGNVYVTGTTNSGNFPVTNAFQPVLSGTRVSLSQSTDTGITWSAADITLQGAVLDISVNPTDSKKMIALTESSIYRTVDGGANWAALTNNPQYTSSLARSPVSPRTLYSAGCPAYKSSDEGTTWTELTFPGFCITQIVCDPTSANTIYAYTRFGTDLAKSLDGGVTWGRLHFTQLISFHDISTFAASSDGSLYASVLENSDQTIGGIFKSTDLGNSWTLLPAPKFAPVVYALPHALAVNGATVYFTQSGGLARSTDAGATWTVVTTAPTISTLAVSPLNPAILYAITASGTVQVSNDSGATWSADATGLPPNLDLPGRALYSANQPPAPFLTTSAAASNTAFVIAPVTKTAFVAKLNAAGSAFLWSSYLGGHNVQPLAVVAGTIPGEVYVSGAAPLPGFPLTSDHLLSGTQGAFVLKIRDTNAPCKFSINPTTSTFLGTTQTTSIDVAAPFGCAWTASSNQAWATISDGAAGTGTGAVQIRIAANKSGTARTATITVGGQTATLTQGDAACNYSLDLYQTYVSASGDTAAFQLTTSPGCPWAITNNYPVAVQITSGASGTASGTIRLSLASNPTVLIRTFAFNVGNKTFYATQNYATGQSQTIAFPAPRDRNYASSKFDLAVSATSGLALTMQSLTRATCTLSGLTLTLVASGKCTIQADQTGDYIYLAATAVTRSFQILAPAATVALTHIGNFTQGQTGASYRMLITNNGPDNFVPSSINQSFTVPAGMTLTGLSGGALVCNPANASCDIVLNLPGYAGIAPGASYPVTLTVSVASNAPATLAPSVSTTINGNIALNAASDPTTIVAPLTDTTSTDYFNTAVNLLRQYGITTGCSISPPMFCPNDNVTRAQMAIFIVRSVLGGDTFPYSATPYFTDVAADTFGFKWIQKMYELGITGGCGGGKYCPADTVTRGQMAVFVIRARLGASTDSTFAFPGSASFTDVATDHPYFKWIQRMKADGITGGCSATSYCPNDPVTRGQMAIFLMRGAFNQLLPGGTAVVASTTPTTFTVGSTNNIEILGLNTHFVQGTTTVDAGPGVTVSSVVVGTANSLTAAVTTATAGKRTIVVTTGSETAVLPNGLTVQ